MEKLNWPKIVAKYHQLEGKKILGGILPLGKLYTSSFDAPQLAQMIESLQTVLLAPEESELEEVSLPEEDHILSWKQGTIHEVYNPRKRSISLSQWCKQQNSLATELYFAVAKGLPQPFSYKYQTSNREGKQQQVEFQLQAHLPPEHFPKLISNWLRHTPVITIEDIQENFAVYLDSLNFSSLLQSLSDQSPWQQKMIEDKVKKDLALFHQQGVHLEIIAIHWMPVLLEEETITKRMERYHHSHGFSSSSFFGKVPANKKEIPEPKIFQNHSHRKMMDLRKEE